jgi:hypothetical protein
MSTSRVACVHEHAHHQAHQLYFSQHSPVRLRQVTKVQPVSPDCSAQRSLQSARSSFIVASITEGLVSFLKVVVQGDRGAMTGAANMGQDDQTWMLRDRSSTTSRLLPQLHSPEFAQMICAATVSRQVRLTLAHLVLGSIASSQGAE